VTIRPDVPVDRGLESLRYRGPDQAACYALFSSLGFRTFTSDFAPTAATVSTDYAVVESLDSLAAEVNKARTAGRIGLRVIGDDGTPCGRASWASRSRAAAAMRGMCRWRTARWTR